MSDFGEMVARLDAGKATQLDKLELRRRRICNFRQSDALDSIITLCEAERLPVKVSKVIINNTAILGFGMLSDFQITDFMARPIEVLYGAACDYYEVPESRRMELVSSQSRIKPTTVELNNFVHYRFLQLTERVNNLPVVKEVMRLNKEHGLNLQADLLLSPPRIRERAILFFALLSPSDKTLLIENLNRLHGSMLDRLTDKKYLKQAGDFALIS
jgi:hypothetical protein